MFGYSATVGIRFSGIGNQSSALLATAAVLVAAFAAWRCSRPWGTRIALAVLVVSFVAITPPLFGQDFGGTLAAAPVFALLGWLLLGRRVTVKAVLALGGILLASGLAVGFLDLLRPRDQRSHVGRFFEKVGNEGFSGFSSVIERKSGENAATFSSTIYVVLIVVVVVAGVLLWFRPPRPLVGGARTGPDASARVGVARDADPPVVWPQRLRPGHPRDHAGPGDGDRELRDLRRDRTRARRSPPRRDRDTGRRRGRLIRRAECRGLR